MSDAAPELPGVTERFWRFLDVRDPASCWEWTGARKAKGYGFLTIRDGGRRYNVHAHRLSYELHHGAIPAGLLVCHRSDNPPCCNPAHLFLGTTRENALDARAKGRLATGERARAKTVRYGEAHGAASIPDTIVALIKAYHAEHAPTFSALAAAFGVSRSQAHRIVRGESRAVR